MAMVQRRFDSRTVEGKVGIVNELGQLIITVSNPVRQGEYVRVLAERLAVREDAIRGQLARLRQGRPEAGGDRTRRETPPMPEAGARMLAERELLHILIASPAVREFLQRTVPPEAFIVPDHRELAAALLAGGDTAADPGMVRARLRSEVAVALLSRFLVEELRAKDPLRAAEDCVSRIRRIELEERRDGLMGALRDAERARDTRRLVEVTSELQDVQAQIQGVGR
jgi:DNA primase